MIDPSFWRGKRVLVTGHTGFKGSWLSLWLQRIGASVIGYAFEPPTDPSLFELADVADGMDSVIADVRDRARLEREMIRARPDIVIHMAAQSLVRASYVNPVETYETNVMGTVHALEAARRVESVRVVIVVTSDKCYQNNEWVWGYRETDALGGFDPYSSSKGAAELVVAAYRSSFFSSSDRDAPATAVASARAGNVIGGGDWATDRLIPDLARGFLRGVPVLIRNPAALRPWQHVLEPLSGYLLLAERLFERGPALAEAWNFGPRDEDARPVSWVADRVAHYWGDGAVWLRDGAGHPHEARSLKLDWSKARDRLGWAPRWSLDVALERTVGWYRSYAESARADDVREATFADIDAYVGHLADLAYVGRSADLENAARIMPARPEITAPGAAG